MVAQQTPVTVSFDEDTYVQLIGESWESAERELDESLKGDEMWAKYQEAVKKCQEFSLDKLVVTH